MTTGLSYNRATRKASMTNRSKKRRSPIAIVRTSSIQGRGVFAGRDIQKGTRVIEYRGERIDQAQESLRYDDDAMDRHHTFLFKISDEISIDGNSEGNSARYINHSCDPNCEAVNEEGRIWIEAIRNIKRGDELTYDYNYEVDGPISAEDRQFYICHCGTVKCRGTILRSVDPAPCESRRRKK